jgi:transcriptional regulator with XRE-family HTH domain
MDEETRRAELARFLRSRRAANNPEALGIPRGTRRRTPGLRREEIALRANIGVTWYTWLEQGRDIQVSREAVGRIAAALNLSPSDKTYFESLTGHQSTAGEHPHHEAIEEAQILLDGFTAGPAMLFNSRFDCVAFNGPADAIYEWTGSPEPFGRNMVWRTFMDPRRRSLYSKAESLVHNGLGILRARNALHLGEPEFESLVKVLLDGSVLFRTLWAEQHTASLAPVISVLTHPDYGELTIRSIRAIFPPMPESILMFVCPVDDATRSIFQSLSGRG